MKVHENKMYDSSQQTYLGDKIHKSGRLRPTIDARVAKGYGAVTTILAILNDIPLAHWRVEAGLQLRQAMFLNGTLFNSESWHGITNVELDIIEKVDEALLRGILKAHAKIPREALYLETGSMPIKYIIKSRRINYLHNILKKDDEELVKEIYYAQKESPVEGDFCKLVAADMDHVEMNMSENEISNIKKEAFKKIVKKKVTEAALNKLIQAKENHSKMSQVTYSKLQIQEYLKNPLFESESMEMLTALRTRTVRGIKNDFRGMYSDTECPLECGNTDTLQHLLDCSVLNQHMSSESIAKNRLEFQDIYSEGIVKQKQITQLYIQLMSIRGKLLRNVPV